MAAMLNQRRHFGGQKRDMPSDFMSPFLAISLKTKEKTAMSLSRRHERGHVREKGDICQIKNVSFAPKAAEISQTEGTFLGTKQTVCLSPTYCLTGGHFWVKRRRALTQCPARQRRTFFLSKRHFLSTIPLFFGAQTHRQAVFGTGAVVAAYPTQHYPHQRAHANEERAS